MKTRQLLRSDLPYKKGKKPLDTINIPVIYEGVMRYVVDIHFTKDDLCFLNNAGGKPTKISELQLVLNDYDSLLNSEPTKVPLSSRSVSFFDDHEKEVLRQELIDIADELKFLRKRVKIAINSL